MLSGGIPGVVAAATDCRGIVYLGALGSAAIDQPRARQPDSVFRLASMTKLVTAIAVLQLVEQGRVELDAPFKRFCPRFRQPPVLRAFDSVTREYDAEPAARDIIVRGSSKLAMAHRVAGLAATAGPASSTRISGSIRPRSSQASSACR